MTTQETISVPLGIIEKWKDIDRTAFMDSIKELTNFKDYSIDPLTNTINIVTKVVKEISAQKTQQHDGYMEKILDLKKKLKETETVLKKKGASNNKKEIKAASKEKTQQIVISQKFGKQLSEARRKFAKYIYSCFLQNFKQKYDTDALEKFILSVEEEINTMFEGDSNKISKHLGSLKINLISPKTSYAKLEMLSGTISAKDVASNKTSVFEDKSAEKKIGLTGPDEKQQQLTGNGEECEKCHAMEAYCYMMQQIRASDEPMTRFLRCRACKDTWTD